MANSSNNDNIGQGSYRPAVYTSTNMTKQQNIQPPQPNLLDNTKGSRATQDSKTLKNIQELLVYERKLADLEKEQLATDKKRSEEDAARLEKAKKIVEYNRNDLKGKLELLDVDEKRNEQQKEYIKLQLESAETDEQIADLKKQLEEVEANMLINASLKANIEKAEEESLKRQEKIQARIERVNKSILKSKIEERKLLKEKEKLEKEQQERLENRKKLEDQLREKGLTEEQKNQIQGQIESLNIDISSGNEELKAVSGAIKAVSGIASGGTSVILSAMNKTLSSILGTLRDDINKGIKAASENVGKVNTRLQGIDMGLGEGLTAFDAYKSYMQGFTLSYTVSVPKYMDSIIDIIDRGIATDVESKALLATLSERMVSTYNVLDEHLTELIRLQQADLSYAQLGSESTLTQVLNSLFGNTQYLGTEGGSGLYDTVAGMLVKATSSMTGEMAVAFEYAVQKWMGSLYAVGLSDTAVESIVSGIVSLATGDVSGLNTNDSLRNLLALSASSAGLSYSEMLTNGLDASNVNSLLESMVSYLAGIYKSTSNQVTKAEWGNIMGLSMQDLRAISNLTPQDVASISQSYIDYGSAIMEGNNQLNAAISNERLGLAGRQDILLENVLFSTGLTMGTDPTRLIAYQVGQKLQQIGSSIGGVGGGIVGLIGALTEGIDIIDSFKTAVGSGQAAMLSSGAIAPEVSGLTAWDYLVSMLGFASGSAENVNETVRWLSGSAYLDKYLDYAKIVNQRGIMYDGLVPTTYTTSSGAVAGTSAAIKITTPLTESIAETEAATTETAKSIESIIDNSQKIESQAKTVVDSSATTVYDVSSLYDALFVNQIAMKVKLTDYDDIALNKLAATFSANSLAEALRKIIDGSLDVDINDSDTNSIIDTIMKVRGY